MSHLPSPSPVENRSQLGWLARFKFSEDIDFRRFNDFYLQELEAIEAFRNETEYIGFSERQSAIREILSRPGETKNCRPKAEKIEAVLRGVDIQLLRAEKAESHEFQRPVAMLDDRSLTGKCPRGNRGPQSIHELHKLLTKKRFRDKPTSNQDKPNRASGADSAISSFPKLASPPEVESREDEVEPDGERRLIYINDLDRWGIYALLSTASYYQIDVLLRTIYHYLAFKASIETKPSPRGLPIFQLAASLPFYTWRSSLTPHKDHRHKNKGRLLRESLDVSFLNSENDQKAFLHPVHISCLITGADLRRWVAYNFIDCYYDTDSNPDSVQYIEQLRQDGDYEVYYDPFTRGLTDADMPIWDPVDFFFLILSVRLDQINHEWAQIDAKLQESFEKYGPVLTRYCQSPDSIEPQTHDEKAALEWVKNMPLILKPLSECLSQTFQFSRQYWECSHTEIKYVSQSTNNKVFGSLPEIGTTIEELKDLDNEMLKKVKRGDQFANMLQDRVNNKGVELGRLQNQLAQDSKRLSIIMTIFCTLGNTSSIFSMANLEDVIPLLRPSFGYFIFMITLIGFTAISLNYILEHGAEHWRKGREKISWSLKIRDGDIQIVRPRLDDFDGQRVDRNAYQT